MPEAFVQLPGDGTGKRLRTRERTIGANAVHEQAYFPGSRPTYWIYFGSVVPAGGRHWLTIFSPAVTGKKAYIHGIWVTNKQLAAVTGVALLLEVRRTAVAPVGGAAVAINPADIDDPALASGDLTAVYAATVTDSTLLFEFTAPNDEVGATNAFPTSHIINATNLLPVGVEQRELSIKAGNGITVKQNTANTVGSFGVLAAVTIDV